MATTNSSGPCVSCRLRRKKCDRLRPMCSLCQRLDIPKNLCVYQDQGTSLTEKDSKAIKSRESARNLELKREKAHYELLLKMLQKESTGGDDSQLPINNPPKFHSGITDSGPEHHSQYPPHADLTGFLSSITLPASISYPKHYQDVLKLCFAVLDHERRKLTMGMADPSGGVSVTLEEAENQCMASLVGAPTSNGDVLIYNLLTDLMTVVPRKELYLSFFKFVRERNGTGFIIGMPRFPDSLINQMESIIQFDKDGYPRLDLDLPKENSKIIILALTLMVLTTGQSITSHKKHALNTQSSENKDLSSVFHRYAYLLLHVNLIGDQIKLSKDDINSPLCTLAVFLVHLHLCYNKDSEFTILKEEAQAAALTTRSLISRAKAQHLNDDLEKWYPRITQEEHKLYRDIWYGLATMEMMECLELGYIPTITVGDFRNCTCSDIPIGETLRAVHEVLTELNTLDGALSANDMLEFLQIGIKKLQTIYTNMGSSAAKDLQTMSDLNPETVRLNPNAISEFYRAAERAYMTAVILGMLQRFHCLCTRCANMMGETPENSLRARAFDVLAYKYSFASLEYTRMFCEWGFIIGDDVNNEVGNTHMLTLFQLVTVFEAANATRSTMWLGYTFKERAGITNQEMTNLLIDPSIDSGVEHYVFKLVSNSGYFDDTVLSNTFEDLKDFAIDDDYEGLIEKFSILNKPETIIMLGESLFLEVDKYIHARASNMDFIKLAKTFIIARRFIVMGMKIWFKDEYNSYFEDGFNRRDSLITENDHPSTDPRQYEWTVDFAGSFKELFEQVIDSNSGELDLSMFFGGDKDRD